MTKKLGTAPDEKTRYFTLDKNVKFEFRLPLALKTAIEEKAREKGYRHLSKYILEILIHHGLK